MAMVGSMSDWEKGYSLDGEGGEMLPAAVLDPEADQDEQDHQDEEGDVG